VVKGRKIFPKLARGIDLPISPEADQNPKEIVIQGSVIE
jgi:hypothetical protein